MQDFSGSYLYGIEKILVDEDTLYIDYSYADTSSDGSIDGNLKCFGMLSVNGHHLTIKGKYIQYEGTRINENGKLTITGDYTADGGILTIDQAVVHVKGDTRIKKNAAINMFDQEDCLFRADGDYVSASRNTGYNHSRGGTLEVQGDLIKKDNALSFGLSLSKTKVVFGGTSLQKVQVPESQKFGMADCIDVRNSSGVDFGSAAISAGQITGFSGIRADGALVLQDSRITLTQDESYSGDLILYGSYLDCNGYQFCLSDGGTLEQMGGLVNLDYGTLSVDGDYILHGNSILQMIRAEDLLQVRGSFNMYSRMNHSSMLKNGRMELWGNFDQDGDEMSFASCENFVIAFMGSGQVAYFDDKYSGFANIDPAYSSVEIIDYPAILENSMSYRISRGILTGLQDVLGIYELGDCAEALTAALGITLAEVTPGIPQTVACSVTTLMEIIAIIQSVYTSAASAGGIYSTAMGEGDKYDKAEAFAHDATMLAVSLIFLWGTASAIKNCTALFKSASQNLIGRTSRLTASEVTQTYKEARLVTSFDDFAEYAKGFLDEDALLYAKEVLGNDADDIARLKKVAQLIEDGSQKIGKKLSKEELKAGLDALWNDGGVEGALGAIEQCYKWSKLIPRNIENRLSALVKEIRRDVGKEFPTGNVGAAVTDIEGVTSELRSYSKFNNTQSKIHQGYSYNYGENRIFKTRYVNNDNLINGPGAFDRGVDSEAKILEDIAHQLGYNFFGVDETITGNVYLITERKPCASCSDVIMQFEQMFPNINLVVKCLY